MGLAEAKMAGIISPPVSQGKNVAIRRDVRCREGCLTIFSYFRKLSYSLTIPWTRRKIEWNS